MIEFKDREKRKLTKTVYMTERDLDILWFINEFGFCELEQILKRFSINESNGYKIMKRLMRKGLIIHERIFHGKCGVYRLTQDGASFTDLPALENVPQTQYRHQLLIVELYIKLISQYPNAHWLSERWLYKDQSQKDIQEKKHIADGMLIFPDGKHIAIEVEISFKGKKRLTQIFNGYTGQFQIDEIWYFCKASIISSLMKLAEKKPFIKIYNLREFLHGKQ